ncbi:MAG: lactate dehydrogenase [Clostridia bacterium]|nr:lactate dehydrogenase [Clostridia bacterium]
MKIYAYDVTEAERAPFEAAARALNVQIDTTDALPTPSSVYDADKYDAVTVSDRVRIDRLLLRCWKNGGVKYLSVRSENVNCVDLDAARETGIRVCRAGGDPESVASFALMLMLMCLRRYKEALRRAGAGDYSLNGLMGRDLKDLTVGVVGTGRSGTRVMQLLAPFGCRILCCDPRQNETAAELGTYTEKEELYRECDLITFHASLTEESRRMVDEGALSQMKNGVILINCANGELMDAEALTAALESGKVGALGMDVCEEGEDLTRAVYHPDRNKSRTWTYLNQRDNVVMTRHLAFYTDSSVAAVVRTAAEDLVRLSENKKFDNRVL